MPEINPAIEQVSLQDFFNKSPYDITLQQVCQIIHKETDTLYEFFYDTATNKAIFDVVVNTHSPDFKRTTYKFADGDITIAQAFELYGLEHYSINMNSIGSNDIINDVVYVGMPISGLDVARGIVTILAPRS
jgi:hypothetical protein